MNSSFNSGISFRVNGIDTGLERFSLSIDWRRHLTLMFKEAMNNAVKHSECANVSLDFAHRDGTIDIVLADDGKGFDTAQRPPGQGLTSMKSRSEKIHGILTIQTLCGKGTRVRFTA